MGFGTLFIGYFLILNLTYYSLTDVIAASVMLLGLYKLSGINKYFKLGFITTAVFLAFSLGELSVACYELFFDKIDSHVLISIMSVVRCLLVGALSVLALKAVDVLAKEVDLPELSQKCKKQIYATAITYAAWIILELPLSSMNPYVPAVASLITILATIIVVIINLSVIYTAYMKICMPGDEELRDKPSRFSFVNEYRERKAEQAKHEAEENLKRVKEKLERKGQRK